MSTELQRDIELIEAVIGAQGWPQWEAAWQRLKPRLTPDREEIAWRLFKAHMACGETKAGRLAFEEHKLMWLFQADAAIKAMGGNDDA